MSEIPADWYRYAYTPEMVKLPWAQKTEAEVERLLTILQPHSDERILDLGCGTGRHSLELRRRGFTVVGVELLESNVAVARASAEAESLEVEFVVADLRELDFEDDFDIVLSLNDGAIGYFETEADNLRTFEIIARILKESGRHYAQLGNVLNAERSGSTKTFIEGAGGIELLDQRWNARTRALEGAAMSIAFGEVVERYEPLPFRKRLYSIEELEAIYASVGMSLTGVFRGNGRAGKPRNTQFEIFTLATKGEDASV